MDLILVRHGQPFRVDESPDGPADPALTPEGERNARLTAAWLASEGIDRVCSSPLRRARETAAPLAEAVGVEVEVLEGVGEFDARDASYIPYEEIPRDDVRWTAMVEGRWSDVPGWMDPDEFSGLVVETLEGLIAGSQGQRVAVFTHGGVINVYLAHVLGAQRSMFFYPGYCSIHRVAANRDGWRSIMAVNETAHLAPERFRSLS